MSDYEDDFEKSGKATDLNSPMLLKNQPKNNFSIGLTPDIRTN